jgi:hypothetical protein
VDVTGGSYKGKRGVVVQLNGSTQATVKLSDGSEHRLGLSSLTPSKAAAKAAPAAKAAAVEDAHDEASVLEISEIYTALRQAPVGHLSDDVWRHRRNKDVYTGHARVADRDYQVDHVVEVQVHAYVADLALNSSEAPVAAHTRAFRSKFIAELNSFASQLPGLNNTTREINKAKEGPFRRFLNRERSGCGGGKTLDEHARDSRALSVRSMIDDGTWARIQAQVVKTWDGDLWPTLSTQFQLNAAAAELYADEMTALLGRMGL